MGKLVDKLRAAKQRHQDNTSLDTRLAKQAWERLADHALRRARLGDESINADIRFEGSLGRYQDRLSGVLSELQKIATAEGVTLVTDGTRSVTVSWYHPTLSYCVWRSVSVWQPPYPLGHVIETTWPIMHSRLRSRMVYSF